MTRFLPLAFLAACSVSHATDQADLVIAVYERDYGDVSDADVECVRDVPVRYALAPREHILESHGAIGQTVALRNARIWIVDGLEPDVEACILRHEYVHTLLWCMTGNAHGDHQVPELGYSGACDAPGSLSAEADGLEEP